MFLPRRKGSSMLSYRRLAPLSTQYARGRHPSVTAIFFHKGNLFNFSQQKAWNPSAFQGRASGHCIAQNRRGLLLGCNTARE